MMPMLPQAAEKQIDEQLDVINRFKCVLKHV